MLRLLVVEDRGGVQTALRQNTLLGCEVVAVSSEMEAAERLRKEKFHGAFFQLGGSVNGIQLAKCCRTSPSNSRIPIALVTREGTEAMQRGFDAGISVYVHEPLNKASANRALRLLRPHMDRERISYARLPLRSALKFEFGGQTLTGEVLNVSTRGMLFRAQCQIPMGASLAMKFSIPALLIDLQAKGLVVRQHEQSTYGVRFNAPIPEVALVASTSLH
jgi:CheY-like chemotaxis protein